MSPTPATRRLTACAVLILLAAGADLSASAQKFSLQTGPPVAAMPDPLSQGQKKFKDAWFVVRSQGCPDVSAFRLTARLEGMVGGTRRSDTAGVVPLPQSGVFAILNPGPGGTWVVALSGTCGTETAGATVRLTDGKYLREGVDLLPHHPTPEEVAHALARAMGGSWE